MNGTKAMIERGLSWLKTIRKEKNRGWVIKIEKFAENKIIEHFARALLSFWDSKKLSVQHQEFLAYSDHVFARDLPWQGTQVFLWKLQVLGTLAGHLPDQV